MIEKIIHKDSVIAIIIYGSYAYNGIKYFSPEDYPLQLGYMKRPKGYEILSHIHHPVQRNTASTQEVLFIKSGQVRIDFYSVDKVFLESRKLSTGDVVLLAGGGHGLEILEEAVIVEVKNGPFIEGADKEKFKTDGNKGNK